MCGAPERPRVRTGACLAGARRGRPRCRAPGRKRAGRWSRRRSSRRRLCDKREQRGARGAGSAPAGSGNGRRARRPGCRLFSRFSPPYTRRFSPRPISMLRRCGSTRSARSASPCEVDLPSSARYPATGNAEAGRGAFSVETPSCARPRRAAEAGFGRGMRRKAPSRAPTREAAGAALTPSWLCIRSFLRNHV